MLYIFFSEIFTGNSVSFTNIEMSFNTTDFSYSTYPSSCHRLDMKYN